MEELEIMCDHEIDLNNLSSEDEAALILCLIKMMQHHYLYGEDEGGELMTFREAKIYPCFLMRSLS